MSSKNGNIAENVEDVKARIEAAARKSGRNAGEITVVAVTKTVDTDRMVEAIDAGLVNVGENRVQELCSKYDKINRKCNWHLIGHLQTNKVKYIVDKVSMIHSVDSLELAREIDKRAEKVHRIVDVLVQVNVAGEDTKFGIEPAKTEDFIRELSCLRNIKVKGLMTIAPFYENPEDARYVFRELNKKFIDIKRENIDNIDMAFLSMGMSNDFEVAIEEGANIVRIGTAIFGKRHP
ncbi:MAG: YggS family pyridoxal phosphate-dependent enzyme [Clostridiales bacterium]|jgi:pyridoxal phosphate enzyme (YggS family)|nr:YggS family pyridoxal phosphate-dependent enzyme [Eubacteriales bacterium]MDH7565214.1 YggS family pyridoxal phosphate-dependent enzyme [Clostridiales bacterium]